MTELSIKVKVLQNHLYDNQLIHGHYHKGHYCTEFLFQLKKATKNYFQFYESTNNSNIVTTLLHSTVFWDAVTPKWYLNCTILYLKESFHILTGVYPSILVEFCFCIEDWVSKNESHRAKSKSMLPLEGEVESPLKAAESFCYFGVYVHLWHAVKRCLNWDILLNTCKHLPLLIVFFSNLT